MNENQPAPISGVHWQVALIGVILYAAAFPFFDELLGDHSRNAARGLKRHVLRSPRRS